MRRKRAVLAVAAARPRERQRDVPAERDPATHAPRGFYGGHLFGLAAALLAAALLAACGSSGSGRLQGAKLVLDFTPNAVHAGIYSALARHLDRDHGVRLHVIAPSAST